MHVCVYIRNTYLYIHIYVCVWGGSCIEEIECSTPSDERSQSTSVNEMMESIIFSGVFFFSFDKLQILAIYKK